MISGDVWLLATLFVAEVVVVLDESVVAVVVAFVSVSALVLGAATAPGAAATSSWAAIVTF